MMARRIEVFFIKKSLERREARSIDEHSLTEEEKRRKIWFGRPIQHQLSVTVTVTHTYPVFTL